jgi:hypothetical protein
MSEEKEKLLYTSTNGDRWFLVRSKTVHVGIRHRANEPSGGKVTDLEIEEFLTRRPRGPEHQELLRLIGTLVERR